MLHVGNSNNAPEKPHRIAGIIFCIEDSVWIRGRQARLLDAALFCYKRRSIAMPQGVISQYRYGDGVTRNDFENKGTYELSRLDTLCCLVDCCH